jgi:hypothetical protein
LRARVSKEEAAPPGPHGSRCAARSAALLTMRFKNSLVDQIARNVLIAPDRACGSGTRASYGDWLTWSYSWIDFGVRGRNDMAVSKPLHAKGRNHGKRLQARLDVTPG